MISLVLQTNDNLGTTLLLLASLGQVLLRIVVFDIS